MLLLPTFNARLNPCLASAAAFTPHAQGQFCSQCQRVVQDFSQSVDPVADLAAARAASPDGRVCGSFRAAQVQRPKLTRRLRWFIAALMLVVGQGLTAREALAQVQRAATTAPAKPSASSNKRVVAAHPLRSDKLVMKKDHADTVYGVMVEQMPEFQGGGAQKVVQYIQQRVVWPNRNGQMVQVEGRVFASFTVGADGRVRGAKISKSLHPLFDAEVLRVVRTLPAFTPGRQNGLPVEVAYTVPINFTIE